MTSNAHHARGGRTPVALLFALLLTGCGGDGSPDRSGDSDSDVVRTADPFARGMSQADFPRVQEIAPGVYTYEQLRSAGDELFTTVSLFMVSEEGVLVADGQGSREETERLLEHVARVTEQPVTHLVIGSDHGDHTAGNSAFPAGIRIFAHPTSAAALERSASGASGQVDTYHPVTDRVEGQIAFMLGGREVEIYFLGRAHTGGDLVVYLPTERVLFMSETYLHRVFPAMRSAFPSEWDSMLARAEAMDVEWFVPGHGFVDSPAVLREELAEFRRALQAVIREGTRLHADGVPLEEAMERADFGELESWSLRESQGPIAIRQVYRELNGELP